LTREARFAGALGDGGVTISFFGGSGAPAAAGACYGSSWPRHTARRVQIMRKFTSVLFMGWGLE